MGVKHFYLWYSKQFEQCLHKTPPHGMDILCIDMNGLFHYCAQEVFEYGVFARNIPSSKEYQGLLGRREVKIPPIRMTKQKLNQGTLLDTTTHYLQSWARVELLGLIQRHFGLLVRYLLQAFQ